jgi:hypothetical protein
VRRKSPDVTERAQALFMRRRGGYAKRPSRKELE